MSGLDAFFTNSGPSYPANISSAPLSTVPSSSIILGDFSHAHTQIAGDRTPRTAKGRAPQPKKKTELPANLTAGEIHAKLQDAQSQIIQLNKQIRPVDERITQLGRKGAKWPVTGQGARMSPVTGAAELSFLRKAYRELNSHIFELQSLVDRLKLHPNYNARFKKDEFKAAQKISTRDNARDAARAQSRMSKRHRIKKQRRALAQQELMLNGAHDNPLLLGGEKTFMPSSQGRKMALKIAGEYEKLCRAALNIADDKMEIIRAEAEIDNQKYDADRDNFRFDVNAEAQESMAWISLHEEAARDNWIHDLRAADREEPAVYNTTSYFKSVEVPPLVLAMEDVEDAALAFGGPKVNGRPSARRAKPALQAANS